LKEKVKLEIEKRKKESIKIAFGMEKEITLKATLLFNIDHFFILHKNFSLQT
jgi:hypothetical protein